MEYGVNREKQVMKTSSLKVAEIEKCKYLGYVLQKDCEFKKDIWWYTGLRGEKS